MDEEDFVLAGLRALRVGVPPHGEEAILRRLHAAGFKAPKFEIPRGRIGAKASSEMRGGRVSVRRAFVKIVFEALPPAMQAKPWAETTLDAVEQDYRALVGQFITADEQKALLKQPPFKAGRDQLRADMRALGIKSARRRRSRQ